MTTKKIYGPWIKWNGGECPIPLRTVVEVKLRCGIIREAELAENYNWYHFDHRSDIVEYRTVTEQADLDAAEKLLRANSYTVIPPAKPLRFEDVTPMTEMPPRGTKYWAVHPFSRTGVEPYCWDGTYLDQQVLRHRMAYLEREHALIAAQHIFGLKGGEL